MKKPILYPNSEGNTIPVYSQGVYDVFVGSLEEDKLPQYVLINRDTSVVEFTTEVTGIYKEWLRHFAPELPGEKGNQIPLDFQFQ